MTSNRSIPFDVTERTFVSTQRSSYGGGDMYFPKDGISIAGLNLFISKCGGENALKGMTTKEVCDTHLKPMTSGKSFVDYIIESGDGDDSIIGMANTFIIHAWKYEFLLLYKAIKRHFIGEENSTFLWIDLFVRNQNENISDTGINVEQMKDEIASIGRTVMIYLPPISNSIVLGRTWCLFELYCTEVTNTR